MKRSVLIAAFVLAAGSIMAADPKDELSAAAKKLADAGNYSWKQTTDMGGGGGGGGGFGGGPVDGQAANGLIHTTMTFNDNSIETLRKGTNYASKGPDGTWRTAAEVAAAAAADPNGGGGGGGGRRGGRGMFGGNTTTPAETVSDLVTKMKGVSTSGGAFVGELTEDGAKANMFGGGFGGRRGGGGGGNGPDITGAKGSVKFWVADGVVNKYELKVQGKVSFNGNDRDIDRTTTVEFKDVGKTKVTAPDDIVKKLQ